MKALLSIIFSILIIQVAILPAWSATVVFKTGFESLVGITQKGNDYGATFDNGSGDDCADNESYCDGGYVDASTGYNVPYDLPGRCKVQSCISTAYEPYFNYVVECAACYAQISSSDKVNGTYSMATYADSTSSARVQLVIYPTNSGTTVDNFDRTTVKYFVKWSSLPTTGEWFLIEEWRTDTTDHLRIVMENTDATTTSVRYKSVSGDYYDESGVIQQSLNRIGKMSG